jgi:predicted aconitase with swiveling domain
MSTRSVPGRVLYPGSAEGPLLKLSAPLSFWGGVDPASGDIILGSHPERGRNVRGTVLVLPEPIGSSSSSYVLLELIHNGAAPAALLLGEPDAILIVGCLVARELGLRAPPVLHCPREVLTSLPEGQALVAEGEIRVRYAAFGAA